MTTTSKERSTWKHKLGFEVEMFFEGQGWQCRCQSLAIETMIENQAPQDMEMAMEDWINDYLAIKSAGKIVAPLNQPKTIWAILSELISDELVIGPRQQRIIFEKGKCRVSLFHDRDGRLRLVARNGLTTTSPPIAHNPISAPVGEWQMLKGARAVYDTWVGSVKDHKARRPLWQLCPAVDALMRKHNLSRDEAVEMYRERGQ